MTTKQFKNLLKKIGFNSISEYAKHLGYSNPNQLSKSSYKELREKLIVTSILEHFEIDALELFDILNSHKELKKENDVLRNKLEKIKNELGVEDGL